MKIVIDIGHAAKTGAVGVGGTQEHAVCAHIAAELGNMLAAAGHETYIVDFPHLSNDGDLEQTVRAINEVRPDISISLHADSGQASAKGAHVIHCTGSVRGKLLAGCIAEHLCKVMPGRAEKVQARRLYVLRKTICPAVLVECGFLTHAGDCAVMDDKPGVIAGAIADGVADYCKEMERKEV